MLQAHAGGIQHVVHVGGVNVVGHFPGGYPFHGGAHLVDMAEFMGDAPGAAGNLVRIAHFPHRAVVEGGARAVRVHEAIPDHAAEHPVFRQHLVLVQAHDLLLHADDLVIQGDQFLPLVRAEFLEFLHRINQVHAAANDVHHLRGGIFQHLLPVAVLAHASHEHAVHLAGRDGEPYLGSFLVVGREVFNVAQPLVFRLDDVDSRLEGVGAAASVTPEVVDDQVQFFPFGVFHDQQHVLPFLKKDAGGVFKLAVLAGAQAVRQVLDRFVRFRRDGARLAVIFFLRHLAGEPAHEGILDFGDAVTRDIGFQRQHEVIGEDVGIQRLQARFRNRNGPGLLGGKHAAAQHAAESEQNGSLFQEW